MRFQTKTAAGVLALSAITLAMSVAWAEDKGHADSGKAEAAYEGAGQSHKRWLIY